MRLVDENGVLCFKGDTTEQIEIFDPLARSSKVVTTLTQRRLPLSQITLQVADEHKQQMGITLDMLREYLKYVEENYKEVEIKGVTYLTKNTDGEVK